MSGYSPLAKKAKAAAKVDDPAVPLSVTPAVARACKKRDPATPPVKKNKTKALFGSPPPKKPVIMKEAPNALFPE